jgi:endonuclease YncB( thermonuclease family)
MVHDFKAFPELTNRQMEVYYFDSPHMQITEDFTARVVKVIDGDTVKLRTDFRDFDFPLRLAYIAAPELNEPFGLESAQWLRDRVLGEEVEIIIDPKNRIEKFGRLLGTMIARGININQESLDEVQSIRFSELESSGELPDVDKELEAILDDLTTEV